MMNTTTMSLVLLAAICGVAVGNPLARWIPTSYGDFLFAGTACKGGCTWFEARDYCKGQDAILAEVPSLKAAKAAHELVTFLADKGQNHQWWVGAHALLTGNWEWDSSREELPTDSPMWASGEPNNAGGDHQLCARVYPGSGYRLDDYFCTSEGAEVYPLCQRNNDHYGNDEYDEYDDYYQ